MVHLVILIGKLKFFICYQTKGFSSLLGCGLKSPRATLHGATQHGSFYLSVSKGVGVMCKKLMKLETRQIAQWLKRLPSKPKDQSLDSQNPCKRLMGEKAHL